MLYTRNRRPGRHRPRPLLYKGCGWTLRKKKIEFNYIRVFLLGILEILKSQYGFLLILVTAFQLGILKFFFP